MPLQIFTAGKRTDANGIEVDFNEATLTKVAAIYDPALHEAPFVLGHPKHDDPAYGWAAALSVEGARLFAEPKQVDPQFAESVELGRFKKVSASFYLPGSPHHPIPESDTPYLRHVGFLGAMPPAVKGMAPIEFSESEEGVFFCEMEFEIADLATAMGDLLQGFRDWLIDEKDLETADRVLSSWSIDAVKRAAARLMAKAFDETEPVVTPIYSEEQPMSDPTLEAREQALADREAALVAKEAANFCDSLIQEGRGYVAGVRDKAIALLTTVPESDSVEFAEGESASPHQLVKDILSAFPKDVVFAEVAKPDATPASKGDGDLMKMAKKIQKENDGMAWPEAVRMAAKELGMKEEA
jgi:hypothetical protein